MSSSDKSHSETEFEKAQRLRLIQDLASALTVRDRVFAKADEELKNLRAERAACGDVRTRDKIDSTKSVRATRCVLGKLRIRRFAKHAWRRHSSYWVSRRTTKNLSKRF